MELFIPNTKEQYSISDKGIIYSNYKYLRNGKRLDRRFIIAKQLSTQTHTSLLVTLKVKRYNKGMLRNFCVNSLMIKLFKIKTPDNYHFYDTINKDGNKFNSSIENIGFKIRMEKASNYPFYPQPFYNDKNRITHKICGNCGNKKEINHFSFSTGKESGNHKTYRNICEPCRSAQQWNAIKSDPERFERSNKNKYNWKHSEKGKAYWKEKVKKQHKYNYENITPHYVSTILHIHQYGLTQKDLPNELIELVRKRVFLNRNVKQLKIKENGKN